LEHHKDDIFAGKDADLLVLVPEYSKKKENRLQCIETSFPFHGLREKGGKNEKKKNCDHRFGRHCAKGVFTNFGDRS
jgi:hypothetical protein